MQKSQHPIHPNKDEWVKIKPCIPFILQVLTDTKFIIEICICILVAKILGNSLILKNSAIFFFFKSRMLKAKSVTKSHGLFVVLAICIFMMIFLINTR